MNSPQSTAPSGAAALALLWRAVSKQLIDRELSVVLMRQALALSPVGLVHREEPR